MILDQLGMFREAAWPVELFRHFVSSLSGDLGDSICRSLDLCGYSTRWTFLQSVQERVETAGGWATLVPWYRKLKIKITAIEGSRVWERSIVFFANVRMNLARLCCHLVPELWRHKELHILILRKGTKCWNVSLGQAAFLENMNWWRFKSGLFRPERWWRHKTNRTRGTKLARQRLWRKWIHDDSGRNPYSDWFSPERLWFIVC